MMQEALPELVAIKKASWAKQTKKNGENTPVEIFRMLADGSEQPVLIANEGAEIEYVNESINGGKTIKDRFILGEGGFMKDFEDSVLGMKAKAKLKKR